MSEERHQQRQQRIKEKWMPVLPPHRKLAAS